MTAALVGRTPRSGCPLGQDALVPLPAFVGRTPWSARDAPVPLPAFVGRTPRSARDALVPLPAPLEAKQA
jgi:hypothetical protein